MGKLQNRSTLDWDDLRIFLAVARSRQMATAARALEIDATTISRRLNRLAAALDAPLFETVRGRRQLTDRGLALYSHAEAIENETLSAIGAGPHARGMSGQVRLSVAEGLATWVLAPRMQEFNAQHPNIHIDLITTSGFLNPSKREADISVMLARPRAGRLVAQRLTTYSLGLYTTCAYLERQPHPDSAAALVDHVLIGYVPDFLYAPELDYLSEIAPGLEAAVRSTSINVQHRLIREGLGIGVLPSFMAARDEALVPLLCDQVRLERSFWLVTHADVRRLARVDAVATWLKHSVAGMQ